MKQFAWTFLNLDLLHSRWLFATHRSAGTIGQMGLDPFDDKFSIVAERDVMSCLVLMVAKP